ncbi:MAG: ROK family protein [bacterium]|nr:ROK family protein [bacterium]
MDKFYYIGIDIGGTKIKIGVVDNLGRVYHRESIITAENLNEDVVVKNLAAIVNRLQKTFPDIYGVGIGCAGLISHTEGIVIFSPNIGWRNFQLVPKLKALTGLKVVLDNDANAAAWGTFFLNYSGKYSYLMCVALGTGIGGGLILDGCLYRGANGAAGEIGHMTFIPDGPECSCGNKGCIEIYSGTKGILRSAQAKVANNPKSFILKFLEDEKITPKSISLAAEAGDKGAQAIWEETGERLGTAFASVINLLNLQAIHITGGLSLAQEWLEPSINRTIRKRAFDTPADVVDIIFGKQKKDMGLIGSGLLVLGKYQQDLL